MFENFEVPGQIPQPKGAQLSVSKHIMPLIDFVNGQRSTPPPIDYRTFVRVMIAAEVLGQDATDIATFQNREASLRYLNHQGVGSLHRFETTPNSQRPILTDAVGLPVDNGEQVITYYDEQAGGYIPLNQARVRHIKTYDPASGYPAPNPATPPAQFPFHFTTIDYTPSAGGVKIAHPRMTQAGTIDGVVYNIDASDDNYIPLGTELIAYHVKGRWYCSYKATDNIPQVKVVRVVGTEGQIVRPTSYCVFDATIESLTGSDMCADPWTDGSAIWLLVMTPDAKVPKTIYGHTEFLAVKISDSFDAGGDTRPLYAIYDAQVDPPLLGIVKEGASSSDAFIDHGGRGVVELIQAAGASEPYTFSVPGSPTTINASNPLLQRVWKGALVVITGHRFSHATLTQGHELHITAAYSAKTLRGLLTADLLPGTTTATIDNLATVDGDYTLPGTIVADNTYHLWGEDNSNVILLWDDVQNKWVILNLEPPAYVWYIGTLAAQLTNPASAASVTFVDTIGSNFTIPTTTTPQNLTGCVGDIGDTCLCIRDLRNSDYYLIAVEHKIFEPLVGIEIDTVNNVVKGHRKKISVMTWTQTGDNFDTIESTEEC